MTKIINGRKIRDEILKEVKEGVLKLSFKPVFCDILVGDDPVSAQYVAMKARTAESVGILFHKAQFKNDIKKEELIDEIKKIENIENMSGIITQLPLPDKSMQSEILNSIDVKFDVDCLNEKSSNLFYENKNLIGFPTALACMHILDSLNLDMKDKKIVVLGQGILVGKPVSHLLKSKGYDVYTINSKTENKNELIKNADVIITAIGQGKFIKGDMIKQDVVIIDAGTSESDGGVVGDVDTLSVMGIASYISPVPGGVGPVTVACLLKNVLSVAQNK